jgi:hypothetical protein
VAGVYYPTYYWTHPNFYPEAPRPDKRALPWVIIFALIIASFYTIYLYIQPDFVLESAACSENYIQVNLITAKAGRFFMGHFSVDLAGLTYKTSITDAVEEGEKVHAVFSVSLAPGTYSAEAFFRGKSLGEFSCQVR